MACQVNSVWIIFSVSSWQSSSDSPLTFSTFFLVYPETSKWDRNKQKTTLKTARKDKFNIFQRQGDCNHGLKSTWKKMLRLFSRLHFTQTSSASSSSSQSDFSISCCLSTTSGSGLTSIVKGSLSSHFFKSIVSITLLLSHWNQELRDWYLILGPPLLLLVLLQYSSWPDDLSLNLNPRQVSNVNDKPFLPASQMAS